MNMNFYDIESLDNVFTLANYKVQENEVEIFMLCDDKSLASAPGFQQRLLDRIYMRNHNFNGTMKLYDLETEEGCRHLAMTFGLSDAYLVNDPESTSTYPDEFRPVCDTDPDYIANPDKYPYLSGYNSTNYDTTMLACFFYETFVIKEMGYRILEDGHTKAANPPVIEFQPTTARLMRDINNELFENYKDAMPSYLASGPDRYDSTTWKIRKNMIMTGRQIDVSNLNEKQKKVGLKRLLGMMGFQILESDKLGNNNSVIHNEEELLELIAYNISDVVNLNELFNLKLYQAQFTLKKQLLKTYPELIYEKLPGKGKDNYKPDIRPSRVRRDRLYIDSTSSQLAQKALCPYNHLKDIPAVSFNYPHPDKAAELGIPVVNVLDEAKKFFYGLYPQPELRAQFDEIYNYYKAIEGKNFNESKNYQEDFGTNAVQISKLSDIAKTKNCIPYFDKDGNPTSCFATFSTGGVHGAEYNYELFYSDLKTWQDLKKDFDEVQIKYPDPTDLKQCGTKPKTIIAKNGIEWKMTIFSKAAKAILEMTEDERIELQNTENVKGKVKNDMKTLMSLYTPAELETIINRPVGVIMNDGRVLPTSTFLKAGSNPVYKTIDNDIPVLFKKSDDDSYKLNPKYVFTSAAPANHEDFTSYYPNLLRMMMAFFNPGLGYDRYAEIFQQKQDYGHYMKDKNRPSEERELYSVLREGTKLILNSASGAGDATFDNNIRMNNTIISMRIIGQLFSWRIGQAQSYYGAKIISTNTDGLYSVMESTINDKILAQESANIGVEIEPEPMYLISKDTNNRIELEGDKIIGASGGTLACRMGPRPDKSLAHPAIIDWSLAEYLTICSQGYKGLSLDKPFNESIGMSILKSSIHKFDPVTWMRQFQNVLASSPGSVRYIYGLKDNSPYDPIILPHYNRVFYMKDGTENTIHLSAAFARVVNDKMKTKRLKDGQRETIIDPIPMKVLEENGVSAPSGKDIVTTKVTGIEDNWDVFILNKDLSRISKDEYWFLMNNIDYDKYLTLLRDGFEKNWRNKLPNRHYIKFFNFGECVATETVMNTETTDLSKYPAPIHANNFVEWNTEPDGTGTLLTDNMSLDSDMEFYAVYQSDKAASVANIEM